MGLGTRRFLGWIVAALIGLLIGHYITAEEFMALLQPILSSMAALVH